MKKLVITFNRQRRSEIRGFIQACVDSGIYPWALERLREEYNSKLPNETHTVEIAWIADLEDSQIHAWLTYMLLAGYDIQIQTPWWL